MSATIQVKEMRRAFYAGVASMLSLSTEVAEQDLSDDEGIRFLESIQQELKDFLSRVGSKY